MSFDGPCSVLPGAMRGFPFETARNDSSTRASSTIDQAQRQQQQQHRQQIRQQQQHQPTVPSFGALGTGARKTSGERRDNHTMRMQSCSGSGNNNPASLFALPVVSASASRRLGGGGGAASLEWDTEDLPDVLTSPRLRSVSSLVLSSDTDAELRPLNLESLASSVPAVRTATTMAPAPAPAPAVSTTVWGGGARQAPAPTVSTTVWGGPSIVDILENTLQPLPPPVNGGNDGLVREQSFPPPIVNFPSGPRLAHHQSFPPPVQPGMALVGGVLPPSDWRAVRMASSSNSFLDSSSGAVGGGGGGGVAASIGEDGEFHHFGGDGLLHAEGIEHDERSSCIKEQPWDISDPATAGSHSINDEDSLFSSGPFRPDRPDRHPSFDKLAAMIPGIPQHFQPPSTVSSSSSSSVASSAPSAPSAQSRSSSCHHGGNVKAEQGARPVAPRDTTAMTTAAAASAASAPATTPGRGRPPGKRKYDAHKIPCRNKVRTGPRRSSGGGKLEEQQRGSCDPSRATTGRGGGGGGEVDMAKQERRRAAIQRYLVKKTRRRFANATRDNSPSRSRPKAAKIRPRLHGKFVKTVPDFIPVTAVLGEAGGGGKTEVRQMARAQGAAAARGRGGGGRGRGRAVKKETFRTSVAGTSSSRNTSAAAAAAAMPSYFQGPSGSGGGGGGGGVLPVSGGVRSGYFWTPPSSM